MRGGCSRRGGLPPGSVCSEAGQYVDTQQALGSGGEVQSGGQHGVLVLRGVVKHCALNGCHGVGWVP